MFPFPGQTACLSLLFNFILSFVIFLNSGSGEASLQKMHHSKAKSRSHAEPHTKKVEHASHKNIRRPASEVHSQSISQILPVEEYRQLLEMQSEDFQNQKSQKGQKRKQRQKPTSSLKKAYDALIQKQYAKAIQLATVVQKDPVFGDYGYWISASAHLGQAMDWAEKKKYASASESARKANGLILQVESQYPSSPMIKQVPRILAESDRWVGNSVCALKKWKPCKEAFERTFLRLHFLKSFHALEAPELSQYALACKRVPTSDCVNWLERLTEIYSKKSKENQVVSEVYQELLDQGYGQKPKIPKIFTPVKSSIPYKAPDLDLVSFETNLRLYLNRKYSAAAKGFRQFLDEFPRSAHRLRASYWLGQALKRDGDSEEARQVFLKLEEESALSFYGILASSETGQPLISFISAHLPLAIDDDPALQPIERYHLERAKILISQKAEPLALMELKEIKPKSTYSSYFLVYLAMLNQMVRNYPTSFQALGELIQRKFDGITSSFGLRSIFPVEYLKQIKLASEQFDLDPLLILSLIKQESAFAEDASSSVGALGLMQLMPFTALDTDPEVRSFQLLQAERNIQVGAKYLKKLLNRYRGNIAYALAAYNAGPGAADRWIKEMALRNKELASGSSQSPSSQDSGAALLEYIETISYRETREYVSGIIRNYFWYSHLLQGVFPNGMDYFWKTPTAIPVAGEVPASSTLANPPATLVHPVNPPMSATPVPESLPEGPKSPVLPNDSEEGATLIKRQNGNA